ncbi:MAG: VOC family protein [Bosea sp. (in: a-proteobacteria)]
MTAPARPPVAANQKQITFLYYRDLPAAMRFYEEVLGLPLAIDQGWSKIYRITEGGYVGLVDETRGSHRANAIKPVQLCIRVADVDAWHRFIATRDVDGLREPRSSTELKIRAFVFNDPEGYQIEIQSALD